MIPDDGAETPPPENAPLIRQAVGFSWTPSANANISTYQATLPSKPTVPYFLPGQAPVQPQKPPKPTKPRTSRKKKNEAYSLQTGRFRLTASTTESPLIASPSPAPSGFVGSISSNSLPGMDNAISPGAALSSRNSAIGSSSPVVAAQASAISSAIIPGTNFPSRYHDMYGNSTSGPSDINTSVRTGTSPAAPAKSTKRTKKSPGGQRGARDTGPFSQQNHHQPPAQPAPTIDAVARSSYYRSNYNPNEQSMEGGGPSHSHPSSAYSPLPGVASGGQAMSSTVPAQRPAPGGPRPLRMVTLLIKDMRSGAVDSQLAEVSIPLRVADDPADGFWANAIDICDVLQAGPSRIDGPAKVYTMRGEFRQFFMRVDHHDQVQVQSAHVGVSKQRTLNVFVEAPLPQGHLPRPPVLRADARTPHNSGSDSEAMLSPTGTRPQMYSSVTREDQIERLSKINYVKERKRDLSPVSESGSYGHRRGTSRASIPSHGSRTHKKPRRGRHTGTIQRPLTPPIPGRLADTQEERDEAIANYIRSHIENHPGWMQYMQSKAKPQRVSEVLNQYQFVEDRVRELIGRKTPAHWDGAPNCYVENGHVWRVFKLDANWGATCQETLSLVTYYGKNGSRYEDSRVVDHINDTSAPTARTLERFFRLLRNVDANYTEEALGGQIPMPSEPGMEA
ncbi:hypothetical protein PAXRUDRAFT_230135 [Paxillus rubicundulus Ve08.2h10]|uniref:Unplaced genomic scaffold scaffold_117, whole genome shotgun sequence n=1 Tax=Paxillus rubicundulus Ve08.2h10 TaxID=930991 RepID=A0A0D0EBC2_9AGAM|nr:hypothetical protein PAXRUDRAFT_230135 [Paxillus rubicundulus Ve08.2h10]